MFVYDSIQEQEAIGVVYDYSFINGDTYLGESVTYGEEQKNACITKQLQKGLAKNQVGSYTLCSWHGYGRSQKIGNFIFKRTEKIGR